MFSLTPRKTSLALVAVLALVVLAYWPGLGGGFIFDDRPNISANTALQVTTLRWADWIAAVSSSPATNFPRPLAMFSFAVNHYFTGLDAAAMKLTNIAIHLLNTLLVFNLARLLIRTAAPESSQHACRAEWAAIFVASAWALNPINLMAVLYVVQRMESLSHVFVFSGLWLYAQGRLRMIQGKPGWLLAVVGLVGFSVIGTLSKESALLLPLYGLCLELCIFRFRGAQAKAPRQLGIFYLLVLVIPAVAAITYLVPYALNSGAYTGRGFSLVERLLTESRVLVDYLTWTIYPNLNRMGIYHDDYVISRGLLQPASTLIAMVFLLGLAGFAIWIRSKRPLLALGLLWFLAAHALTATIVPLELLFEHRNYFASFGLCVALADLLLLWSIDRARILHAGGLAVLFVSLTGMATALRAWEWRDPLSFAISESAKHPDSPRAVYALGVELSNLPELRADSPIVTAAFQAFDRARDLPGSNILPDQAALMLASRLDLTLREEWWRHMQAKLRERPLGPQELAALAGLGNCAIENKCSFPEEEMMSTFKAALSKGPNAEVESILGGYFLSVLRQPDVALFLWEGATQRQPKEPQYRISLIKLLIALRKYDEAADELAALRELGRFGQFNSVADKLSLRLAQAEEETLAPAADPSPIDVIP